MANPHRKGSYFENKVASLIREKFDLTELDVHRNSESGTANHEYADIRTPFPWLIECKFWNNINYARLLKDWPKVVDGFKQQLLEDVQKYQSKFKIMPFYTLLVASPRQPILATIDYNNFYENDLFKETSNIYEVFPKVAIYDHEMFIVIFEDLLDFLFNKLKEKKGD